MFHRVATLVYIIFVLYGYNIILPNKLIRSMLSSPFQLASKHILA